jgi:RNA 2',3'-cyclic 3'-phosphodiesterase
VAKVEAVLEPMGFPRESRPFSPHLTLGRVRSNSGIDGLVDAVKSRRDIAGPGFVVCRAILFESVLKPAGAEYTRLCAYDFR